jgi:hypothetical protein
MYPDDTNDYDYVLGLGSVGSVVTALYQNVLASAPNVIACDAEEQERPWCPRKQRRIASLFGLWRELQDEVYSQQGCPYSQVRSAKTVTIRATMNQLAMPTGKDSAGFPVGDDYINHADLLRICSASSPCSFWPEEDKLDVWDELCYPFANVDFNPRAMEFNMEPYHDPTLPWPSRSNEAQPVHPVTTVGI